MNNKYCELPPRPPKLVTKCDEKASATAKSSGIRLPHLLQILGPKHFQILSCFMPSLMVFGAASTVALLYFTDWKVIVKYVPFYGGKFTDGEE